MTQKIFRTPQAAEYIGLAASTLEKMRVYGTGPRWVRLTRRAVGYDVKDLDVYLESQRRTSTSDQGDVHA
jgi:predicted DNA-binding transcriptional regulator AlpA